MTGIHYQALQCNHPIVMYEVTLSIQRLVNKYANELWDPTWSVILDIIEQVIAHIGKILQIFCLFYMCMIVERVNGCNNNIISTHYYRK